MAGTDTENDCAGWPRVALEERCERECASHHGLGGRKYGVASVHVAKMNLAVIRGGGPIEQRFVFIEESELYRPIGQRKSGGPCKPPPKTPTRIEDLLPQGSRSFDTLVRLCPSAAPRSFTREHDEITHNAAAGASKKSDSSGGR